MASNPKLSIILPTYNTGAYLFETVESIRQQSYQNFEIIIVDDGSTDDTKEVIKSLTDDRLRIIFLDENSGSPSLPRNVGIANSTGEYVFMFDSDDIMLPGKLERSTEAIKGYNDIGLLFTNSMKIDEVGGIIDENILNGSSVFASLPRVKLAADLYRIKAEQMHKAFYSSSWISPSACVIPKKVFETVGDFDESLNYAEDRDLFFRISSRYDFAYLDMIGHKYRKRQDGQVGQISAKGHLYMHSLIRAVTKQLENETDKEAIRAGEKIISKCYYSIGYHYQSKGMFRKSRKFYLESMKYNFNAVSLKGTFKTLIPQNLYAMMKRAKDNWQERHPAEK